MNEKYKIWIKKFGIAGFLFFLIKGILWLIFGTALYKWFKSIFILSLASLLPLICLAQKSPIKLTAHEPVHFLSNPKYQLSYSIKPEMPHSVFCKMEDRIRQFAMPNFKFRLGSSSYTDHLEYAKYLSDTKPGESYSR
ncbi:MAG TPA: hypothetical protein VFX48_01335 [Saprospiraceae bacterium]|nr:hypothetical protein [Saprospiraceae bacterium]